MFELKSETTPVLADKVGLYGAVFVDEALDAQVCIRANDIPEKVTDLGRVQFNVSRAYVNDPWFSTSVHFTDDLRYWVMRDEAQLPRSVVTKCIDFALEEIPRHFPNIALPGGYPVEYY